MTVVVAVHTLVEMGPDVVAQPLVLAANLRALPDPLASALAHIATEFGPLALSLEAIVLAGEARRRCDNERGKRERQDQDGFHTSRLDGGSRRLVAAITRRPRRFSQPSPALSAAAAFEGGQELARRFHAHPMPQGGHEMASIVGDHHGGP